MDSTAHRHAGFLLRASMNKRVIGRELVRDSDKGGRDRIQAAVQAALLEH